MASRADYGVPDRRRSVAWACLALLAAMRSGFGAEPGYDVSVGVAETDNVALASTDRKSDTIVTEGVDFTWHEQRPVLNADIDADLNYLEYLNHTYGDEVLGNFIGQARATAVPDMFFWNISDNFGQNRVNPLEAINPGNRENINYFDTGPQLILPLGATTFLQMNADYGNVKYQVSPLDNQREDAGIALLRKLSQDSIVSFNVRDEHVGYSDDEVGNVNYNRQDVFVRYDSQGARTQLGVDLGYSKMHDDIAPVSNVLARLELSRKISPSSTVVISFGHEYSDSSDAFRLSQTLGGATNVNTQSTVQTGAPFTTNHAQLAWNFQRNRTGFSVSVEEFKDSYQQPSTLDDNRFQAQVSVSRRLAPDLQVSLNEYYFHQHFMDILGSASEITSQALLTWKAGRHLSVVVEYEHTSRSGDIQSTDYTENLGWVRLSWGRPAAVAPGPAKPPLPGEAFR